MTLILGFALAHAMDGGVRRFAVVIGANDGGPDRIALRYAHRDADAIADVLTEIGGVLDDDLLWLVEPDVTTVYTALADLTAHLDESPGRNEVIFYYSGHSDENGLLLGGEPLPYTELRAALDAMSVDVRIAILDSCASGGLLRQKGGQVVPPFLVDESSRAAGFAYIASSTADESAQEADRLEGSFFTHSLTAGLRGAADTTGDSRVTFNEAYQYAFHETLARTERTQNGPQHAAYENQLSGTGDLVLTDLNQATTTVHFSGDVNGTVSVRDAEGRLIAEVRVADQPVDLALAAGEFEVTVVREGAWAETDIDLISTQSSTLSAADFVFEAGEPTTARGGDLPSDAPMRVTFWPGLYDDYVKDHVLVNGGVGVTETLDGVALGLVATTVQADARGLMATLGANVVHGEMRGIQLSGAWNKAGGLYGLQFNCGVNRASGLGKGAQIGLIANVADVTGDLAQFAPVLNWSGGSTRGLQAGLVNWGREVEGLQFGAVNVAGHVSGMQVGLINYADTLEGSPIGVINIIRDGRQALAVYVTETDLWNVDLRFGGRQGMYTVIGAMGDAGEHAGFFGGLGGHVGNRFWGDFDVSGGAYWFYTAGGLPPTPIVRSRLMLGAQVYKRVGIFGGGSFTWRIPSDTAPSQSLLPDWYADPKRGIPVAWPGVLVGMIL